MKTKSQSSARPVLRWPGSKNRMLKHLLPLVKERPHTCYVEGFAGSLALLMAKERSEIEVVNDINDDLIGLYRSLQFHLPEMVRQIDYLFASRKNLKDFIAQPGLTEIQRAARFLLRNRTSFSGGMKSFGVCKTKGGGVAFDRLKVGDLIGNAHERLNGVIVENVSYERLLKNQDSKETLWFFDPPYVGAPTGAYDGWTLEDVELFRKRLKPLKGEWIVTLNDQPEIREIFQGCNLRATVCANRLTNTRTHGDAKLKEIIITPK